MKPSKLLVGAAGLSIAASARLMGVGSASADICITPCDGGIPLPVSKLDGLLADGKADVSDIVIVKVMDKVSNILQ